MRDSERIIVFEELEGHWTAQLVDVPIIRLFGNSAPEALAKLLDVLNVDPDQCTAVDGSTQEGCLNYLISRPKPRQIEAPKPSTN